jgi:hypothetical protein
LPFTLNTNEWNHIVMTWQTGASAQLTVYINGGNLPMQMPISNTAWVPDGQLMHFGTYAPFLIDEIELYDHPLTPAEITHLRMLPP